MAIENSNKAPDTDRLERTAERLGIALDDHLRELLANETDPALIAAELRGRRASSRPSEARTRKREEAADPSPPSTSGVGERMLGIRINTEHYEQLSALAAEEGVPPTTMARLLLNRALREAEHHGPRL